MNTNWSKMAAQIFVGLFAICLIPVLVLLFTSFGEALTWLIIAVFLSLPVGFIALAINKASRKTVRFTVGKSHV